MKLIPYLNFDGQCEAAFKFYEQALGGKIVFMMTHGNSPMAEQTAPEWRDKVMHIHLEFNGMAVMGSDCPPGYYQKPQGVSLSINVDKIADAERLYNALVKDGKVTMALDKTFWAERFGMLQDQFGISWMINCEKEI
ncbi:VOC family protein [Collimonas sp. NPDC087041]|uniref:VOC family protein n=1 Tax=Collimonas sp. NPDC087041 TaxID=3363960 RepID=UPI0038156FB6